jgi:hypothetical protein
MHVAPNSPLMGNFTDLRGRCHILCALPALLMLTVAFIARASFLQVGPDVITYSSFQKSAEKSAEKVHFSFQAQQSVREMPAGAVAHWLRSMDLPESAVKFESNGVDGPALLGLDNEKLKNDLEIWRYGDRSKILSGVQKLSVEGAPVDCLGAYGSWGECSVECGGGVQQRTFAVTTPAARGGANCAQANGAAESVACRPQPCPIACAGQFSSWGACSAKCGGGVMQRKFLVTQPAAHGGAACAHRHEAAESSACSPQACPMDCVGGWGNWGECSDPCGEGKRERIFFVILAPEPGGAACSVEDGAADHERCGTTNDECDVKARLTTAIKDDANVTTAGAVAPQYEEVSLRFTVCITLLQEVQKGQKSKAIAMAAEQQIRHLQAALTDQQRGRAVVSAGRVVAPPPPPPPPTLQRRRHWPMLTKRNCGRARGRCSTASTQPRRASSWFASPRRHPSLLTRTHTRTAVLPAGACADRGVLT